MLLFNRLRASRRAVLQGLLSCNSVTRRVVWDSFGTFGWLWGPLRVALDGFGGSWGDPWRLLGVLGGVHGGAWGVPGGPCWPSVGPWIVCWPWVDPMLFRVSLGLPWPVLGDPWGSLGGPLGRLGGAGGPRGEPWRPIVAEGRPCEIIWFYHMNGYIWVLGGSFGNLEWDNFSINIGE
jgi:hypothetical protein